MQLSLDLTVSVIRSLVSVINLLERIFTVDALPVATLLLFPDLGLAFGYQKHTNGGGVSCRPYRNKK